MSFVAAIENAILIQQDRQLICPDCGKTRVEHYFKKSQTCGSLAHFKEEK